MYAAVENASGNVPAFLIKLWTLVEDSTTDDLIRWDTNGTGFHVYDQQRFSREILPLYFKHNNIASFIRQLNMYGFRKVTHIDQGGLKIEKDDLHFQHPYFQKGERDLLQNIKRKVSSNQTVRVADPLKAVKTDEVSRVLTDMNQLKAKQDATDQNLEYIRRENKLLWREVATLRQKHHKQQQIVNKLIQFLVSLVSSNRTGLTIPTIRRMPLAINDVSQVATSPPQNIPDSQQEISSHQAENYTVQSPQDGELVLTTADVKGPIIHELTDPSQSVFVKHETIPDATTDSSATVPVANYVVIPKQKSDSSQVVSVPNYILSSKIEGGTPLMSPKIEAAPSLEDALYFGLNVPSSSSTKDTPGPATPQVPRASPNPRKRSGNPATPEFVSPAKKIQGESNSPQELLGLSESEVQKSQDTAVSPKGDASLALAASSDDDLTLTSDTLDILSSDLDGLKGLLQEQYKVDPNFLMDLFDSANPWPVTSDNDHEIQAQEEKKDEAGTSGDDPDKSITGTELIEYNPKELFPDLFFTDNVVGDIDDID